MKKINFFLLFLCNFLFAAAAKTVSSLFNLSVPANTNYAGQFSTQNIVEPVFINLVSTDNHISISNGLLIKSSKQVII